MQITLLQRERLAEREYVIGIRQVESPASREGFEDEIVHACICGLQVLHDVEERIYARLNVVVIPWWIMQTDASIACLTPTPSSLPSKGYVNASR